MNAKHVAAFAFTLVLAHQALACDGMHSQAKKITVDELGQMLAQKTPVTILDANGADTRAELGTVPGAKLLSSYETYDVQKELPADKAQKLVFYCGGEKCSAAPKAAQRAIDAGYTNVMVMSAGIRGWAAAGKPTTKQPQA